MKEYLVKGIHGNYSVVDHHSGFDMDRLIEIPEGAVKATLTGSTLLFWDEDLKKCNNDGRWRSGMFCFDSYMKCMNAKVIWEASKVKEYSNIKSNQEVLISGKEALIAIADGQEVLAFDTRDSFKSLGWFNAFGLETNLFLGDTLYKFKLKPQTIEANLELPAPFTPKEDEWCYVTDCGKESGYYAFKFNPYCKNHINYIQFGAYRTEDEIKQVVEAYRGVKNAKV